MDYTRYDLDYYKRNDLGLSKRNKITIFGFGHGFNIKGLTHSTEEDILFSKDIIELKRHKNTNRLIGLFYRLLLRIKGVIKK